MTDVQTPISNLSAMVERCLRVNTIAAIRGPAGVGKTELVRALGRKYRVPVYTLIGSLCDPTDINGFPTVSPNRMQVLYPAGTDRTVPVLEFAPRDWMVRANAGAIIFIDELTSAPPPVKAAMLHLLTQWQAGDFDLDPNKVGFVAAFNAADEAVNGSELGFPMVNRLTHFDFPMSVMAAKEWTNEFPGYWGAPKVTSFLGQIVPESFLLSARASVAGYIRSNPSHWHHLLWKEEVAGGGGKDKKTAVDIGDQGAVTPRSWDRVAKHMALAAADGVNPQSIFPLIVGEIGPGPAATFETHLKNVRLVDPEVIIANPDKFELTNSLDIDFATVMGVCAAVRANLSAPRFEAAAKVVNACAGVNKKKGAFSYEAGAAAATQLTPLFSGIIGDPKNTKGPEAAITRGLNSKELVDYITRIINLFEPYQGMAQKMVGKRKV